MRSFKGEPYRFSSYLNLLHKTLGTNNEFFIVWFQTCSARSFKQTILINADVILIPALRMYINLSSLSYPLKPLICRKLM